MQPTRDVDVTYEMARGLHQRLRWNVGAHMLRVDPPSPGLWMLMDFATRRAFLVQPAQQRVLESPAPATPPGIPAGAGAQPAGTDRVAGADCTDWRMHDNAGNEVVLCMTDDGVLLRARTGEGQMLLRAVSLSYTPQDPSIFALPPDFSRHNQQGPPR